MCVCVTYTYLQYVTEQIWLQHSKYSSHRQHAKWAHRPKTFALYLYTKITTNCDFYYTLLPNYMPGINTATKLDLYAIYANLHNKFIWEFLPIYATYDVTDNNHATRSNCILISHITPNKYGCHIGNIAYMDNITNGHMDNIFANVCQKEQPSATYIAHVIANNAPETNTPPNYAYMPYISST